MDNCALCDHPANDHIGGRGRCHAKDYARYNPVDGQYLDPAPQCDCPHYEGDTCPICDGFGCADCYEETP